MKRAAGQRHEVLRLGQQRGEVGRHPDGLAGLGLQPVEFACRQKAAEHLLQSVQLRQQDVFGNVQLRVGVGKQLHFQRCAQHALKAAQSVFGAGEERGPLHDLLSLAGVCEDCSWSGSGFGVWVPPVP